MAAADNLYNGGLWGNSSSVVESSWNFAENSITLGHEMHNSMHKLRTSVVSLILSPLLVLFTYILSTEMFEYKHTSIWSHSKPNMLPVYVFKNSRIVIVALI